MARMLPKDATHMYVGVVYDTDTGKVVGRYGPYEKPGTAKYMATVRSTHAHWNVGTRSYDRKPVAGIAGRVERVVFSFEKLVPATWEPVTSTETR